MKDTYKDFKYSFTSEEVDSDDDTFRKHTSLEGNENALSKNDGDILEPKNPLDFERPNSSEEIMVEIGKDEVNKSLNQGLIDGEVKE